MGKLLEHVVLDLVPGVHRAPQKGVRPLFLVQPVVPDVWHVLVQVKAEDVGQSLADDIRWRVMFVQVLDREAA